MTYQKFRVSNLTKKELERAIELANLTETQIQIVLELNKEKRNDEGIMLFLKLTRGRYYAEKRIAIKKLIRVLSST